MLSRRPLFNHDPQIIQLLNGCFNIATDFRLVFLIGERRLGHSNYAPVAPCTRRQGNQRIGKVGRPHLHFLPPRGFRAQHRSLTKRAGVCVHHCYAQINPVGIYCEKWIGPQARLMHIDIEALGGQWYTRELSPLIVALGSCCLRGRLRLMLGIYGILRNTDNCLFFLVARNNTHRKQ